MSLTSPRSGPRTGWRPSSMVRELDSVLADEKDGVTAWFWSRWRSLASSGLNEEGLGLIVLGYRRELWLWLAGERTWAQCCSGLIGRINRRLAGGGDGTGVSAPGPPAAIALQWRHRATRGVPVLRGVDWRVGVGDRWVILGPNGSGKTTLLQVAGARLWPTAGTVEILGARLGAVDVRTLRPRVALVSGAVTRQLRADLAARDVVVSGRHGALETWWNRYTEEDWEKADAAPGPRWRGRPRLSPVRGDLGGRAPAGAPGQGAHERPGTAPLGRAICRSRPGSPRAVAGPTDNSRRRPWQPADRPRDAPL